MSLMHRSAPPAPLPGASCCRRRSTSAFCAGVPFGPRVCLPSAMCLRGEAKAASRCACRRCADGSKPRQPIAGAQRKLAAPPRRDVNFLQMASSFISHSCRKWGFAAIRRCNRVSRCVATPGRCRRRGFPWSRGLPSAGGGRARSPCMCPTRDIHENLCAARCHPDEKAGYPVGHHIPSAAPRTQQLTTLPSSRRAPRKPAPQSVPLQVAPTHVRPYAPSLHAIACSVLRNRCIPRPCLQRRPDRRAYVVRAPCLPAYLLRPPPHARAS